jgi:hypothetical protein
VLFRSGFFIPPAIFVLFWVFVFILFGKEPARVPAEPVKAEL